VKPKLKSDRLPLIIGFDTEWKTEGPEPIEVSEEDATEDDDAPDALTPSQLPHNVILSYQWACWYRGRGWAGILYTRAGAQIRYPHLEPDELKNSERVGFASLLAAAIQQGIRDGHLRDWPKEVIAAAHWTRADLSAMADFDRFKNKLDAVHKTYVTLKKPLPVQVTTPDKHRREFKIHLIDTLLLVPGSKKNLAALGDLYSFRKLDPGHKELRRADGATERIPYIDNMDLLLRDDPELYEAYAVRDAEISAKHVYELWSFARTQLDLKLRFPPVTLGSLAQKYLLHRWATLGIDANSVLDRQWGRVQRFNTKINRYLTMSDWKHSNKFLIHQQLAKFSFHGGRNECFYFGPTVGSCLGNGEQATFTEFDLIGAYPTAMSAIGVPDYANARYTTDPTDFSVSAMGFVEIRFKFPEGTRFPSLPVLAPNDHGLVYPLEGETFATAPEIAVAGNQGAEIEIRDGVIIPFAEVECRPFLMVLRELQEHRQKHASGTLANEMFKQLANSLYGKLGQGLKGTTAFDTRTDRYKKIGESRITNAFLAAHVTGLIRAGLSELIASVPHNRAVVSVTTDGFITDASLEEIDLNGPVARNLSELRRELGGGGVLLEPKYKARQLLSFRTRGITTLEASLDAHPKLARGGMREPGRKSQDQANGWFCRAMLLRQSGDQWSIEEPPPFSEAHRKNFDHVFVTRSRAVNFEYDMKRRLVPLNWEQSQERRPASRRFVRIPGEADVVITEHVGLDTQPWRTIDEFNEARALFDQFRKAGGQLKTWADWMRWQDYQAGADASRRGLRRSAKGTEDQARRLFLRAYHHRLWGLPGGDYKNAAARLTAAGYRTTAQDFKNAARAKGGVVEHAIPADGPGIRELIAAAVSIWPTFEWRWMVVGADADYLRKMPDLRGSEAM
jgi:hypothetical protein